jgi:hypothetical protein
MSISSLVQIITIRKKNAMSSKAIRRLEKRSLPIIIATGASPQYLFWLRARLAFVVNLAVEHLTIPCRKYEK